MTIRRSLFRLLRLLGILFLRSMRLFSNQLQKFLLDFQDLPSTPYEIAESIELLRAVEQGIKVRTAMSLFQSISVDTENDRQEAETAMRHDPFYLQYREELIHE